MTIGLGLEKQHVLKYDHWIILNVLVNSAATAVLLGSNAHARTHAHTYINTYKEYTCGSALTGHDPKKINVESQCNFPAMALHFSKKHSPA